ncbi:hypothetical protein diail_3546 [Diaporthe ilicicola]|nr:hypothetical protein diail_3546 [Diaporthe ilicicola]
MQILQLCYGAAYTHPSRFIPTSGVDVRDVALVHLKALEFKKGAREEAAEFIVIAGPKENWTWEQVAEYVRTKYPALGIKLEGPFEEPPSVDTQKAGSVFGMKVEAYGGCGE